MTSGATATFTGGVRGKRTRHQQRHHGGQDTKARAQPWTLSSKVLNVTPPSISTTTADGGDDFGICAGAELDVVASSVGGDEPVLDWGWNLNEQLLDGERGDHSIWGDLRGDRHHSLRLRGQAPLRGVPTPYYLPTSGGHASVTVCVQANLLL